MVRGWWVTCALAVLVGCSGNEVGPTDDERNDGGGHATDGGGNDASTGNSNGADGGGDETDAGLGPCDGGQSEGCIVTEPEPACGDGALNVAGEQCDDGNDVSDDGCTATCMRDPDYACPVPGERCVNTVRCGDSKISGSETCEMVTPTRAMVAMRAARWSQATPVRSRG